MKNVDSDVDTSLRDGSARDDEQKVLDAAADTQAMRERKAKYVPPYERWIVPVQDLSWFNPKKQWNWFKFLLLRGVFIDVVTHDSALLHAIHARANRYDVRVEHMWTYCQVVSAMLMSISHGSNDIANALGPISAVYATWQSGAVDTESDTPIWLIVIGALMLGTGFWFFGYHVMRSLGNKITQMSPTRGFSIELGAAITVLMASRLGLPVSTTQCLTGAALGVALMNYDLGAVNWRQIAFIFSGTCIPSRFFLQARSCTFRGFFDNRGQHANAAIGWVLTLPCAGLIAGLLCVLALNAPSF